MPGAEGRTGFPFDALPWSLNWGLIILELAPYLILIGAISIGVLINRLRFFRRDRGAVVENIAGTVSYSNGALPYVLAGAYVIIAVAVLLYTLNNAIFGEQY